MTHRICTVGTKSGSATHLAIYDQLPRVGSDTLKGAYLTSCGRLIESRDIDLEKSFRANQQASCKKCKVKAEVAWIEPAPFWHKQDMRRSRT
jgi:hypothetical protein